MKLHSLPYPVYVETHHNEWVSQLPEEWEEKRVKDFFRLVTDLAPKDNDFELLSLYTALGVKPRKDMEQRGNKSVTTEDYWIVKKGDIIVNKLLAWMGAVGLSDYDGVTSPAYDILRRKRKNKREVDERFYTYLFRTEKAKEIFRRHSRGIMEVRLRLYFDKFGALTVPAPSFVVQKAIADYLDAKTKQIDRKIELLEQKAEKYADLKQALINETVTRGLDKTVPMKDSGAEWLGQIPAHWGVKRIKEISTVVNGATPKSNIEDNWDGNITWITPDDLGKLNSKFIVDTKRKITEIGFQSCGTTMCPVGSIVISSRAPIGYIGILSIEACTNQGCKTLVLNTRLVNKGFAFYYLVAARKMLEALGKGTTFTELSTKELSLFIVPLPTFTEQKVIADYLEAKTAHIEKIIETINLEVEKLKELRKTLINDVVTGKIKVYQA